MRHRGLIFASLAFALAAPGARAVELAPGDVLVVDTRLDTIFRVDPATGDRTVVASKSVGTGELLTFPTNVVVGPGGDLFLNMVSHKALFRIDPT